MSKQKCSCFALINAIIRHYHNEGRFFGFITSFMIKLHEQKVCSLWVVWREQIILKLLVFFLLIVTSKGYWLLLSGGYAHCITYNATFTIGSRITPVSWMFDSYEPITCSPINFFPSLPSNFPTIYQIEILSFQETYRRNVQETIFTFHLLCWRIYCHWM